MHLSNEEFESKGSENCSGEPAKAIFISVTELFTVFSLRKWLFGIWTQTYPYTGEVRKVYPSFERFVWLIPIQVRKVYPSFEQFVWLIPIQVRKVYPSFERFVWLIPIQVRKVYPSFERFIPVEVRKVYPSFERFVWLIPVEVRCGKCTQVAGIVGKCSQSLTRDSLITEISTSQMHDSDCVYMSDRTVC